MNDLVAPSGPSSLAHGAFSHSRYTIKRPILSLFGRVFRVFADDGRLVLFVRHKLMTFKDEWNIYADEDERQPLMRVKARQAIGLNIISDIFDAQNAEKIGTVRNRGLKSLVRDTWEVLDATDQPVGEFVEDSNALIRRFIPLLLGHWHLKLKGNEIGKLDQVFRFFSKEFTVDVSMAREHGNTRLMLACSVLALMREISRESQG